MPVNHCPHSPVRAATLTILGVPLLVLLAQSLRGGRTPQEDDLSREARRGHELDEAVRLSHRREQERHRLVVEVGRGRMPLPEAAAHWMALHRQAPIDMGVFREAHPGASDEERHCRGIIDLVTALLNDDDPCQAQAVRARLARELDQCLRHGPLSFRDPRVGCGL